MADWRPGSMSAHKDYELHEELYTPDGRCVAVIEAFAGTPDALYCNALSPDGRHHRLSAAMPPEHWTLANVKDWAERTTGLKPATHSIKTGRE